MSLSGEEAANYQPAEEAEKCSCQDQQGNTEEEAGASAGLVEILRHDVLVMTAPGRLDSWPECPPASHTTNLRVTSSFLSDGHFTTALGLGQFGFNTFPCHC